MPKQAPELSALAVRRLSDPGLHAVGGVAGLYLRVSDTGAKYWVWRGTIGGRRRDAGIGPYPEISLARAREKAAEMREAARNGMDPVAERQAARDALRAAAAKRVTFDDCAARYLEQTASAFKNPKHRKQWHTSLERYASPHIGALAVDRIELAHIVDTLRPIWEQIPETASRVRGRIEKVLDYAKASGYRDGENPAAWRGNLDAVLPAPSKIKHVKHHRALDWREAPAFLAALRQREGMASRALEFLMLTAARSGEVRGATWDEIEGNVWTVPAERMKAGKAHAVPLPDDALAILEALPRMEGSPYIFPAVRGGMLSDMALSAVMRRMEVNATPHGLRSTFRDWVSERTSYAHEVAEQALAHTIPSAVERAYRRGSLLEKRRRLMADWTAYLNTGETAADVVGIREAR
mgnify:CR=1 FL=1